MDRRASSMLGAAVVALTAMTGCSSDADTEPTPIPSSAPPSVAGPTTAVPPIVQVLGMSIWIRCEGSGEPTVLLEAGSDSQGSTDFPPELFDALSSTTRTCTYDRPGTGRSDAPIDDERTVDDVNRLTHDILEQAGVPGPIVLAANSGGGILSIEYARRYREDVAGLVLLDVPAPQADLDPTLEGVSPETNSEHMDWADLEHRLAVDPPDLGDLPVVIVTASFGQSDVKDQSYWLALSSDAEQVELEGEHAIQMSAPSEVADLIRSML